MQININVDTVARGFWGAMMLITAVICNGAILSTISVFPFEWLRYLGFALMSGIYFLVSYSFYKEHQTKPNEVKKDAPL